MLIAYRMNNNEEAKKRDDVYIIWTEASFRGGGLGAVAPPQGKRKKEKKKKKKEKKKKEKEKRKKEKKRQKGTMNSVKILNAKCCFFQFFNSPVALKN